MARRALVLALLALLCVAAITAVHGVRRDVVRPQHHAADVRSQGVVRPHPLVIPGQGPNSEPANPPTHHSHTDKDQEDSDTLSASITSDVPAKNEDAPNQLEGSISESTGVESDAKTPLVLTASIAGEAPAVVPASELTTPPSGVLVASIGEVRDVPQPAHLSLGSQHVTKPVGPEVPTQPESEHDADNNEPGTITFGFPMVPPFVVPGADVQVIDLSPPMEQQQTPEDPMEAQMREALVSRMKRMFNGLFGGGEASTDLSDSPFSQLASGFANSQQSSSDRVVAGGKIHTETRDFPGGTMMVQSFQSSDDQSSNDDNQSEQGNMPGPLAFVQKLLRHAPAPFLRRGMFDANDDSSLQTQEHITMEDNPTPPAEPETSDDKHKHGKGCSHHGRHGMFGRLRHFLHRLGRPFHGEGEAGMMMMPPPPPTFLFGGPRPDGEGDDHSSGPFFRARFHMGGGGGFGFSIGAGSQDEDQNQDPSATPVAPATITKDSIVPASDDAHFMQPELRERDDATEDDSHLETSFVGRSGPSMWDDIKPAFQSHTERDGDIPEDGDDDDSDNPPPPPIDDVDDDTASTDQPPVRPGAPEHTWRHHSHHKAKDAWRWMKHHKLAMAGICAAVLGLLVLFVALCVRRRRAAKRRAVAAASQPVLIHASAPLMTETETRSDTDYKRMPMEIASAPMVQAYRVDFRQPIQAL